MTSVQSYFAQRDNRFAEVQLTRFIKNNGTKSGISDVNQPAVVTLNVAESNLFIFDTRPLTIRAGGSWYLVGIEFTQISPPKFYPGLEINIIINVKDTNSPSYPLVFRIQKNPAVRLDYADERTYIELDNQDYADTTDTNTVYTYGHRTITLISTGQFWVVKSSYLNNGPSSLYM